MCYCFSGITLSALWVRLNNSEPAFQLKIDDNSKAYIWANVARHPELSFYELETPRPKLVIFNRYDHMDKDLGICIEPVRFQNIETYCV